MNTETRHRKQDTRLISFAFGLGFWVFSFLLTGCAQQQQFQALEQICVPGMTKADAMQAAEDVLRQMHFSIDKADTGQGVVRTRPLAGAKWFEFWRSDNAGSFNSAEANLHTLRRTVELDISRQGTQLCIGCDVKVQKLSLPEVKVSSTAKVYGMFSRSSVSRQTLKLKPELEKSMAWIDLGRDIRLETQILTRIQKQIARPQKENKL